MTTPSLPSFPSSFVPTSLLTISSLAVCNAISLLCSIILSINASIICRGPKSLFFNITASTCTRKRDPISTASPCVAGIVKTNCMLHTCFAIFLSDQSNSSVLMYPASRFVSDSVSSRCSEMYLDHPCSSA